VSAPGDYHNGKIGGMIGKGNRSTRRKPAPVPLCPSQTQHAARTQTLAAAVRSQRLTAELRHGRMSMLQSSILKFLLNFESLYYKSFVLSVYIFI
jgi:hypothetical protein